MNKDKHVLPDTSDMLSNRILREAENHDGMTNKIIYGPNNQPIRRVNINIDNRLSDWAGSICKFRKKAAGGA